MISRSKGLSKPRMRRVLLTVHKFFPEHRAGTEVLTLKVAQELRKRGSEVLVVSANPPDVDARHAGGPAESDYVYEGIPVHVVEEALRLQGYTFKHEYYHPAIKEHFGGLLTRFKPDLVHAFHCQNLSAGILAACDEKKIPFVLSLTDFWFVCPVVQLKRPDGAMCRGPKAGASNCLTCYTPELFPPASQVKEAVEKKYSPLADQINRLAEPVKDACWSGICALYCASKLPGAVQATVQRPAELRQFANRAKAIMVPTKLMRDIFAENGITPSLLQQVPFGLDTEPLVKHQSKTKSDLLRIGFIGTIFEHKGVDILLKAFQSLPRGSNAVLKIYGNTNQFPDYGKSIVELAGKESPMSDRIEFAGTFPNTQLGEVLSNLDVLVVPSRWYENTPLVIQSAFASKTPVIATDLGGMSELVKHNQNGLTFPLNDSAELAGLFKRLLNEPGLLQRLTANIKPERTTEEMVDDIQSVYERVLSTGAKNPDASAKSESMVI